MWPVGVAAAVTRQREAGRWRRDAVGRTAPRGLPRTERSYPFPLPRTERSGEPGPAPAVGRVTPPAVRALCAPSGEADIGRASRRACPVPDTRVRAARAKMLLRPMAPRPSTHYARHDTDRTTDG